MRRRRSSENGQALVEFALFLPVFLLLLVGASDLAFFIIQAMAVQEAAAEGANYGSAPGNQNDTSGMVTWANQAAYSATLSGYPTAATIYTCTPGGAQVTATTTCPNGAGPMEYVKVTATANTNPIFKSPLFGNTTITATATYRVAWHQ